MSVSADVKEKKKPMRFRPLACGASGKTEWELVSLDFLQAPFPVVLLKDKARLDAVGQTAEDQYLAATLAILLSVEDVVN